MGAFAHARVNPARIGPVYVPPHRRPTHIRQIGRDTCAVACCAMAGDYLGCREFSWDELLDFMTDRGIYLPGRQSLFHALDRALIWLGLRCRMEEGVRVRDLPSILRRGAVVILEEGGHVLIVYSVNVDGTFVVGDPAMTRVSMQVRRDDYRLARGTGRVWIVWR